MLAEASLLVALTVQHGTGAESCMRAPQLQRSVERRLKRKVFVQPEQASLRFVVAFSKRADELQARIEVSSIDGTPRGARVLVTTSHCSALDDSLALSVALLVDQPPEPEEPEPPANATTAPLPPVKRAPEPATAITIPSEVAAPREPWHASAGVGLAAALGVIPGISPALAVQIRIVPRSFVPTTFSFEGFLRAEAERNADSGARFRLMRAGISLCPPLVAHARGALGVCVGQKLGWLQVEGFGFDHDARERRLTYALTLGTELRLRLLSPVSLRGYLGGEVPVLRDRFASGGRNPTTLFQASPVALAAELGLEAELW